MTSPCPIFDKMNDYHNSLSMSHLHDYLQQALKGTRKLLKTFTIKLELRITFANSKSQATWLSNSHLALFTQTLGGVHSKLLFSNDSFF